MNLVFCVDRLMLAALHVAASSVLQSIEAFQGHISLHIISADLDADDISNLQLTLSKFLTKTSISLIVIDTTFFDEFPSLLGSNATYYRLVVPELVECARYLYLDVDILCLTDLSFLYEFDLQSHPIGLVPEAPLHSCADPDIAQMLGNNVAGNYFNAGIMLVDTKRWKDLELTKRCLEFVGRHKPKYHDQSAINFLLHGQIAKIPSKYNLQTNMRSNWPVLINPFLGRYNLLHFVDYPKPWSPLARWIHPMGKAWWKYYKQTFHAQTAEAVQPFGDVFSVFRYWHKYSKSLKDRLLFGLFSARVLRRVKGI